MAKSTKILPKKLNALLCTACTASVLVSVSPALADENVKLDELVVSGGLTPVEKKNYGRASTVITGEELVQRGVKTVADGLRQVPGFHVSRSGSFGGFTQIRIRGLEADHVLVLIDGVETADSGAEVNFGDLALTEIERIEILRGPQSAIYGSKALAGVVNIITKRGIRKGYSAGARIEKGSGDSKAISANVRGGNDKFDVAFSISRREDDGWDVSGSNGEKDGSENSTVNGKINVDLTSNLTLRAQARKTKRFTDFDATSFGCGNASCYVVDNPNLYTDGEDGFYALSADYLMFDGSLQHTPFVQYADRQNETLGQFGLSNDDASTLKYGYKLAYYFGKDRKNSIVGLVEKKEEDYDSSNLSTGAKSRTQTSVAGEFKGYLIDNFFVQAGVRHDKNSDFEDALTWSASASYFYEATKTRLHASVGKGIKNPSFTQLFGFFGTFVGNPNLQPEESIGWDVGVEQSFLNGALLLDVTYFDAKLTDEITQFNFITPVNDLGESDRKGVEVSATISPFTGMTLTASYTYLDATDAQGAPKTRRPKHAAGANINYVFLDGKAQVGADLTYNGDNFQKDFGAAGSPTVTVNNYFVVDLNASYKLTENLKVYGILNNAFDEDYEEVLGYATQPLTAYVGLKLDY